MAGTTNKKAARKKRASKKKPIATRGTPGRPGPSKRTHTLGKAIQRARIAAGLSVQQAADHIGRAVSTYKAYEQNEFSPTAEDFMALCSLYGASADEIMGLEPPEDEIMLVDNGVLTQLRERGKAMEPEERLELLSRVACRLTPQLMLVTGKIGRQLAQEIRAIREALL